VNIRALNNKAGSIPKVYKMNGNVFESILFFRIPFEFLAVADEYVVRF
jgi:hypothetical protein